MEFKIVVVLEPQVYHLVCLMGEPQNVTCDASADQDFVMEFDDAPDYEGPQVTAVFVPGPSSKRGQAILGLASFLIALRFVATKWLPQQRLSPLSFVSLFASGLNLSAGS